MAKHGGDDMRLQIIPQEFVCPLTHEVMRDPVILLHLGQSFERCALEEWLKSHSNRRKQRRYLPNRQLKSAIEAWLAGTASDQGSAYGSARSTEGESDAVSRADSAERLDSPSGVQDGAEALATLADFEALLRAVQKGADFVRAVVLGHRLCERVATKRDQARALLQSRPDALDAILETLLESSNGALKVTAATLVRCVATAHPDDKGVDAAIPALMRCLQDPKVGAEPTAAVVLALDAIAKANWASRAKMDELDVAATLVVHLTETLSRHVKDVAMRFVMTLASNSNARCTTLVDAGVVSPLANLLADRGLRLSAARTLHEIAQRDDMVCKTVAKDVPSVLAALVAMLDPTPNEDDEADCDDESGGTKAALVLMNKLYTRKANIAAAVEAGAIKALVKLLRGDSHSPAVADLQKHSALNLAAIASYKTAFAGRIAGAGGVSLLCGLVRNGFADVQEAASLALHAVVAANTDAQATVADCGALPDLVELLEGDCTASAKEHAALTLHSMVVSSKALHAVVANSLGLRWRYLVPSAPAIAAKIEQLADIALPAAPETSKAPFQPILCAP